MTITNKKMTFIGVSFLLLSLTIGIYFYLLKTGKAFWQSTAQTTITPAQNPFNSSEDEETSVSPPATPEIGVREVLSANLLGKEGEIAKKVVTDTNAIPKTQQPLELHGIIYNPHHANRAVALIAQTGSPAKAYSIGENLPTGSKVHAILADSVQIIHDEIIESLELPRNTLQLNNQQPLLQASSATMGMPIANAPMEVSLEKTPDGFLVTSPQGAASLGLNVNDKIISISGYDFADLENDPTMLEQLLAQPSIDAGVERNGESINIPVPPNLINTWRSAIKR